VLIGTEEDSPNITDTDITDLCGKTSLDEAYHIINGAKLFIGNDSGLLHLALCTNTETIGVFTATDPQIVLPIDTNAVTVQSALPCSPCEKSGNTRTDCNSECVDENIIDFILYSEKSGSLSNF
jgi:ADP-heptose:LPS heptosyltransferase